MSMMKWRSSLHKRLIAAWGKYPFPDWLRSMFLWVVLPKFLVGAVAVVVDADRRVLLFRHTYRPEYPWGLPSGWLKKGEHAHDAIVREVLEESGYHIDVLRSVVVGGDRKLQRLDLYYECELTGGTFRASDEVSEANFVALDALPDTLEPFHHEVISYTVCHPERSVCPDEKT